MENTILICKKSTKEDPESYKPISLTSVFGKVMDEVLLETITSQMKQVIGKRQNRFTDNKSCQINLVTFYSKILLNVNMWIEQSILFTWTLANI